MLTPKVTIRRAVPMVRIDKKATRLYVLDTNVLIHDPSALYQFEEHEDL